MMDILLSDEQDEPVPGAELLRIAETVLRSQGAPETTKVAIALIGEDVIAGYNERFLDRSGPTDVLAFPVLELAPGSPPPAQGDAPVGLGDVFIAPTVVRRNAAARGVAYEDELALMVVHGLLHLLGWDHTAEEEAKRMEALEGELLARVGRVRP